MKHKLFAAALVGLASIGISACATAQLVTDPASFSSSGKRVRVTAVGYGTMSNYEGYTPGQRRLMAIRAARLDAYRNLAEQLYGVRIKGNTTVSALMAQSDSYRVYLDSHLKGAKVVSVTPMADGNYETEVELELDEGFFSRTSGG